MTKEKIKNILSKYDIEMIQYADKDNEKLLEELVDLYNKIRQEAYENGWSDCRKKRKEVDEKFIREETEKQIISDYSKNLRCLRCGILKDNKLIEFCPKCLEEA